MPKPSTMYRCQKCDSQFPKWQGRCTECGAWGTLIEEQTKKTSSTSGSSLRSGTPVQMTKLNDVSYASTRRIPMGVSEVDRVLGGGLVLGGVYLLTGDPGVGKSTLLLQLAASIKQDVLYFSAEESLGQIKNRVDRLGVDLARVGFAAESDLDTICATLQQSSCALAIIDSLQTMRDASLVQEPGSVTQIKTCTAKLVEVAKQKHIALILVGHVTKSGNVAGPKTLEHLVDGVLYLEGDQHHQYRILRSTKNRFGSIDEIGVFEVDSKGLHPASNPSEVFLAQQSTPVPGSVITPVVEGSRVFFVEYQALVSRTSFGYPVRKSVGFDPNRLQMLVAVLVKRLRLPLDQFDVHLNVAGGMKMQEPACDMAVVAAVVSALKNIALPRRTVVFGEVGLAGEVRPVPYAERRITEAKKLGYTRVLCPDDKTAKTQGAHVIHAINDFVQELGS
ncbi:MAG: DNA repair protein RadA [Patescibacteria group bacterium]